MDTAIELYSKINDPIKGIKEIGELFAKSGMFGCEKAEQGMVLAMACLTEKLSPLAIKRKYHLQQGELSMRADAMLADFRTIAGGRHKVITRTSEEACVELTLDGNTQRFSFSWDEAKQEPFVWSKDGKTPKKNWATPRARTQMLWARAVSDGVRTMAPHIVAGSYTPEEIDDFDHSTAQSRELLNRVEPSPEPKSAKAAPVEPSQPVPELPTPAQPPQAASVSTSPEPVDIEFTEFVKKAEINPETGKLTAATVQTLQHLIGAQNEQKALDWLKAKNQVKTSLFDLPIAWAQKIIDKPEGFIQVIGGTK